jgi:hypothetical protein
MQAWLLRNLSTSLTGSGWRGVALDLKRLFDARPHATNARDQRLDRFIDYLPGRVRSTIRWPPKPSSCWTGLPAGVLLVCGRQRSWRDRLKRFVHLQPLI